MKLRTLNHGIQQIAVSLLFTNRVAEVGSLSARAIFLTKKIVRRVFAIFATNASFLCGIANLIEYNMQYIPRSSAFLAQETLFLT